MRSSIRSRRVRRCVSRFEQERDQSDVSEDLIRIHRFVVVAFVVALVGFELDMQETMF
jgi:type VI protein secretion system component VasF